MNKWKPKQYCYVVHSCVHNICSGNKSVYNHFVQSHAMPWPPRATTNNTFGYGRSLDHHHPAALPRRCWAHFHQLVPTTASTHFLSEWNHLYIYIYCSFVLHISVRLPSALTCFMDRCGHVFVCVQQNVMRPIICLASTNITHCWIHISRWMSKPYNCSLCLGVCVCV